MKKTTKDTVHFVPEYFLAPVHPISIDLVGAGGNGSQMLSALARMNHALLALGHPGLYVKIYDPDTVQAPNIGRQLFTQNDLGQNKAECLASRFNRMFGTNWDASQETYGNFYPKCNIIISCVDNKETRQKINTMFRSSNINANQAKSKNFGSQYYNEHYSFYWLDLGNTQNTGQAILGSNRVPQPESENHDTLEYLPTAVEQFDFSKIKEQDSGPSCSMAEALSKQDLFINSTLVQASASLLWSLLRDIALDTRGLFLNLENYRMSPLPIKGTDRKLLNKKICR